jgi:UDP-glucose 4-epimerase
LPITKPGSQKRRFTHIDDIVNGLILVGKKGSGDGYGIGADNSYTIIEIAKMLKMNYQMKPAKKGNRLNASLKTSKTKKLGWKTNIKLKDYLKSEI